MHCKTKDILVSLWVHEISRVFQDRLINNDDRIWYYDLIMTKLGEKFAEMSLERD